MSDDWRQVHVEPSLDKAFVTEDGRLFQDSVVTIPIEWATQMHHGYRCARCMERFENAWPERCRVCQFEVAKYQRQALEEQYKGVDTSLVYGVPMEREREVLEAELHRPKGQATMAVPKKRRK